MRRSRCAPLAVVLIAIPLICTAVTASAAVAADPHRMSAKPANPRVIYVEPAPRTVTSSNGTPLSLTVKARYLPEGNDGHLTVDLATPGATGNLNTAGSPGDDHSWSFPIRGKRPVTLAKSGVTAADFGKQTLGKFGSIHLVFSPTSTPEVLTDCDGTSASQSTYRGSLTGRFAFDTGTGKAGWGAVKGSAKALGLNHHASVVAVYGEEVCGSTSPDTCPRSVAWQGGSFSGGTYDDSGALAGFMTGSRVVNLAAPKRAQRIDNITRETPVSTVATSNGTTTLTITTDGHGATGSATIATTAAGASYQGTCGESQAAYTTTLWPLAPLTNGAQPLHVKAHVFSSVTEFDTDNAAFSQSTGPA